MKYKVVVTLEAEDDLLDIHGHIAAYSSPEHADRLIDELERTCKKLGGVPLRGHYPPELERVGITLYREIHHRHYRIVYEVQGKEVCVHAVLDGRRDLGQMLERRLVR